MQENYYNMSQRKEEHYMKAALAEALKALKRQEVPVGAVVVCNDMIIASGHNLTETLKIRQHMLRCRQ